MTRLAQLPQYNPSFYGFKVFLYAVSPLRTFTAVTYQKRNIINRQEQQIAIARTSDGLIAADKMISLKYAGMALFQYYCGGGEYSDGYYIHSMMRACKALQTDTEFNMLYEVAVENGDLTDITEYLGDNFGIDIQDSVYDIGDIYEAICGIV